MRKRDQARERKRERERGRERESEREREKEREKETIKLTPLEQTKFINYDELLKIRQDLYHNDWLKEYETTALNKYKNSKLRIKSIKALLLSFYLCFLPLRLEAFKLKLIKDERDYKNNDASIYIKDDNNIIIYLNLKKKHKPIIYDLNDSVDSFFC